MRFRVTPRCECQGTDIQELFPIIFSLDSEKDGYLKLYNEMKRKWRSEALEVSKQMLKSHFKEKAQARYLEVLSSSLQIYAGYLEAVEKEGLNKNVAVQKQKIEEISYSMSLDIRLLEDMCFRSMKDYSIAGKVEKSRREKALEAVYYRFLSVKEVCGRIHPGLDMYSDEGKKALKATYTCLLRLYGKKPPENEWLSKGKLVWRLKTKDGIMYKISIEGERKLDLIQQGRIKAENNKVITKQMQKMLEQAEKLVLEIDGAQECAVRATKGLICGAGLESLCKAFGTRVKSLRLQVIADQKEIIEKKNYLRVDTFIHAIKTLMEDAASAVSIVNSLLEIGIVEKLILEEFERIRKNKEENRAYIEERRKEFEDSMRKKMGDSPFWSFFRRGHFKRP